MFIYEYALKFTNGLYYTGRVNNDNMPDNWQGKKHEAFTYTEKGAYTKINKNLCFKDCTVERVLYLIT